MKTSDKFIYLYGYFSLYKRFPAKLPFELSEIEKRNIINYITSKFSPENKIAFELMTFLSIDF